MESLSATEVTAYGRSDVTLRFAWRSEVGRVRANNEDTVVVAELAGGQSLAPGKLGRAGALFGVCDGMGGAAAGEVASRLAAKVVTEELTRVPLDVSAGGFALAAREAVRAAGVAIRQHAERHAARKGMGTTCSIAAVRGALMVVAHVGDSRVYLLRAGELRQVTRDQTWENELLAQGRVKPSELGELEPGRAKAIVQAVGTTEPLNVEVTIVELLRGDVVLVCSDGLSGMVADRALQDVLASAGDLEVASDELVRLALEGGGRDNLSFIVVRFEGAGLRMAAAVELARLPMVSTRHWWAAAGILATAVVAAALATMSQPGTANVREELGRRSATAVAPPVQPPKVEAQGAPAAAAQEAVVRAQVELVEESRPAIALELPVGPRASTREVRPSKRRGAVVEVKTVSVRPAEDEQASEVARPQGEDSPF